MGMPEQQQMTRYLLGGLPEDESIRLEQRFFTDKDCFEQLLALEDELMYDYLRAELPAGDRARFEQRFLNTGPQRQKAQFAGDLLQRIGRAPESGWWRPAIRFSLAAAALVLLVFPTWMTLRLRRDLERPLIPPPPRTTMVLSIALTPGQVRGDAEPKRIRIPADIDFVQFQLERRGKADYQRYRAAIRTAEGAEVWSEDGVPTLAVRLPAQLLPPNDYELTLQGRAPGGALEDAGDYYFTVSSR